jgi:hypothetical protein
MLKPFDENYPITQVFGNKLILNGVDFYGQWGLKGHNGIDYGTPTGVNILAPHKGTIKEAYYDEKGYGWYVKIENDIEGSVLGHMLSLAVKIGDIVSERQKVGVSDNTGASTGSHLHWGYYRFPRDKNNGYNGFIDQTPYLTTNPTHNTQPSGDSSTIRDFLISKGYSNPETHFEVIKVMYESDLKLKSGQFITKEDCSKEKEILQQNFNKDKENWETAKKTEIVEAVKLAKAEVQSQYQDYVKVKDSGEYKFALFLFKILHLNKKGGEL